MPDFILANGKRVEVSQDEVNSFITQTLIPNAYWRYTGQLTEQEVMRFLKGGATGDDLKNIAQYILTYFENLAFAGYLFDKADGEPDRTREFNMPAVSKLRELYQKVTHTELNPTDSIVNEMESICLEIGADPL